MDISNLLKSTKIVQPMNDICICGHLISEHDSLGVCEDIECQCMEPTLNKPPTSPAPSNEAVNEAVSEAVNETISKDSCSHLCSCGKWWTHGPWNKCRFPDLLNHGKCQTCLSTVDTPYEPLEGFQINSGKPALDTSAQKIIRQNTREVCKNMNIQQLTYHIEFLAKRIEELRVQSLETAHMRREAEEEEIKNIPESEREKFIQALRRGDKKKASKADRSAAPVSKQEKLIQSLMKQTGKSREIVEAMLND